MLGTKTVAAIKRGVEAAFAAGVGYLVIQWWNAGDQTLTGAVDIVQSQWDHAGGAALGALLVAFGYTRSPLKNLSPVAELAPAPLLVDTVDPAQPEGDDNQVEGV